ncbi:MAG: hypothetical protein A2812_02410 [Candidatus Staskawiczbacteria bacterium RIFCSPHIGHO2_01_FULL_36_16]|uniref:Type II secretion system protein J n=1 Tax=Candidatus Staskawiczbacteria bacterium RIFCSPHIGHO2_01_FULL_36_16 TaxID=1802200 RepID=A0A1G2HRF3_9BACT|nr:MAG: hypothetical protein A2812_02410 [Candidatus Staskawiczbacteria bacterium RIFCSPHIGHO2_01_FULL_36_16]
MFQVSGFKNKGFTLIEVIVSMAVFLLVAGMAVSIFISIVTQQRRILSEQQLINQISYVLEYMSKALRMAAIDENGDCVQNDFGDKYEGGTYVLTRQNIGSGLYRGIRFKDASAGGICHEFFLHLVDGKNILKEIKSSDGLIDPNISHAVALTSGKIQINSIEFRINGESGLNYYVLEQDSTQPRITIFMEVQIPGLPEQTAKKIQTTVSQRNLNAQ